MNGTQRMKIKENKMHHGFTLIEMAISMIIIGVLLGAVIYPYSVWLKKQRHDKTINHVERMSFSVGAFRSANGRYPCPAPIDTPRTDPNYGRQTDCSVTSIPAGTCSSGLCIANSRRTLNTPADIAAGNFVDINSNNVQDGWELNFTPRVRIGAMPFRELNIPEEFTLDAYGNRILYAVTEVQASNFNYNVDAGGISVEYRDQSNVLQSRINTPHSAHFVVLSHGSNQMGAYTKYGVFSGSSCNNTAPDGENCDHTIAGAVDPTFYVDDYTSGMGNTSHDDIALHQMPLNAPLWARSPENPSAIYAILSESAGGNVGSDYLYNFFTNIDPNFFGANTRLWIRGNMLVDEVSGLGGDTLATQFCNSDGTGCFPADLIGGTGDQCTNGAMFGVDNAAVACTSNIINIDCPSGQILKSISNGQLLCSFRPCVGETVTSCSQSFSLPTSDHGDFFTFFSGDFSCTTNIYSCNNGVWSSSSSGQCSCTPSTSPPVVTSCTAPATGTITTQTTQICEFQNCYETTNVVADCECPSGTVWAGTTCACLNGASDPPTCTPPPVCDPNIECCTGLELPPICPPPPPPPPTCPSGTYWNGVECICINGASDPPICTSPPPTCPPGTFWNRTECECTNGAPDPPNCTPPPNCPPGTFWNGTECECINGAPDPPVCSVGNPPCYGGANPPPCVGP
jgi:prepilin-type N-terminal cleavage/methylation domain-containing protein